MQSLSRLDPPDHEDRRRPSRRPNIVSSASAQTGVNTAHIDRSIDPCTDLYMFSNGAWYNATEIPADRATWGAWGELYERNLNDQKVSS